MLLKGIVLILIGLSGIFITLIWTFKSFSGRKKDKPYFLHDVARDSCNTSEIFGDIQKNQRILDKNIKPLEYNLKTEEGESTILLDDMVVNEYMGETVLLEEEKSKT
jgi:hypothetical protein